MQVPVAFDSDSVQLLIGTPDGQVGVGNIKFTTLFSIYSATLFFGEAHGFCDLDVAMAQLHEMPRDV